MCVRINVHVIIYNEAMIEIKDEAKILSLVPFLIGNMNYELC